MDYDGGFIMQKTVDWSLLNDGMTIPVSACALLKPQLPSHHPQEQPVLQSQEVPVRVCEWGGAKAQVV